MSDRTEIMDLTEDTPKEFRAHAKNFLVTYSQCPLEKEDIHGWFLKNEANISQLIVGRETHADGNFHLHVFISFGKRRDLKNPRVWDIEGYHPNIQVAKKKDRAREYACKDGDIIGDYGFTPHQFRRDYGDYNAYMQHRRLTTRLPISWPIELPRGGLQERPGASDKKCCYWIFGPADSGKTRWFMSRYAYRAYFKIRNSKYRWEGYAGEDLVLYDDIFPKLSEILTACQYHQGCANAVPGETRYQSYYFRDRTRPVIIVLANTAPAYSSRAFDARFTTIEVEAGDCLPQIKEDHITWDQTQDMST